ncbi:MAG: hypothetical protein JW837_00795, partial [Sedimentisphaerales bacterium]|nr:hypothetical protein [Sedimentisphaerales bacterium]
MQILDFIHCFLPARLYLLSAQDCPVAETSLPFNPTKLVFFVIWFYLCLYFIQRIQFSPLVPKKYKSISYIVSLVAGPILFLVLLIIDTAKKASKSDISFFETIAKQFRSIIANIRSAKPKLGKQPFIKLLDSSGRSIKEIYGHSSD